ncbi:DUF397 domain-containing protein [Streptomyces griseoincarnatus]
MTKPTHMAPELTAAGAVWRKSTYSDGAGNNCIEAAAFPSVVGVRDSKFPEGAALVFPRSSWSAFVSAASSGELQIEPTA